MTATKQANDELQIHSSNGVVQVTLSGEEGTSVQTFGVIKMMDFDPDTGELYVVLDDESRKYLLHSQTGGPFDAVAEHVLDQILDQLRTLLRVV